MAAALRLLCVLILCIGTAVPPRLHARDAERPGHDHAMMAMAAEPAPCHDSDSAPQPDNRSLSHLACMLACACLPAQPASPVASLVPVTGKRLDIASDHEPASALRDRRYRPPAIA